MINPESSPKIDAVNSRLLDLVAGDSIASARDPVLIAAP